MSADRRGKAGPDVGSLTPGAHLRAEIRRLGLDQVAVSKATGVSRQSVNNIINGRQPISRAMAGKLGRLTGRSSDYWLSAVFSSKGATLRKVQAQLSGLLVNHQIIRAVRDGVIHVSPFDAGKVRSAAIDLTSAKGLTLAPGAVGLARTKERIALPLDYLGRIGILGRLTRACVLATHAFQLEPGFKGQIEFCLFNAGDAPLRLRAGERVLGLEIVRLSATPDYSATT
jgi:addiction module HigA family antidote